MPGQTLILEKFGTTPTYRVGLAVEENIITAGQDMSLYDPVGHGAIGADRYRITLRLAKKPISSPSNDSFIELMKVTDGHPAEKDTYLGQLITEDEYTERHSRTFGNYVEEPFNIELREHSSSVVDHNGIAGVYSTNGDSSKLSIGVEGGKAVLNGKTISIPHKQYVNIDKQRGSTNLITAAGTTTVAADFGTYVVTSAGLHSDISGSNGASTANTHADRTWLNFSPQTATDVPFGQNSSDNSRIFLGNSVVESLAEASIRNIERDSIKTGNNSSDEYRIYLFDIQPFVTMANTSNIIEDAEFLSIKSQGATIDIENLVKNVTYKIISVGNSDFTLVGSANSNVGTEFVATGVGTGTGTAAKVFKRIADLNTELGSNSTSPLIMEEAGSFKHCLLPSAAVDARTDLVDYAETVQHYRDTSFTTFNDSRLDSLVFPIPKDAIGDDGSSIGTTIINRMRATQRQTSADNDTITFPLAGSETFDITNNKPKTVQILDTDTNVGISGLAVGDIIKGQTSGAYGKITNFGEGDAGSLGNSSYYQVVLTDVNGDVDTTGSPTLFQVETAEMHIRRFEEEYTSISVIAEETIVSSWSITHIISTTTGHSNKDYLLFGAAQTGVTSSYFFKEDGLVLQFNSTTAPTSLTIKSPRIITSKDYVLISSIKTTNAVELYKTVKEGTKHVGTHSTTSTLSGDIGHIQLDHADVLDKNWKVYENKDGFDAGSSNQATTSDTDISSRYTLNTGQRDNSYSVGFLQLKDNEPMPSGSLYIVYYYLQHGTDAQQIGQGSAAYRVGDYISVDSYPVGETFSGFGDFTYSDIPTFTSPTTGEKIRLADAIDFRPVKDANDHYLHNTRIPFHTTVDIASLKYFQPRIDKLYLTEGETAEEILTSDKLEIGEVYKILTTGTSGFTSIGAEANTPGTIFRATGKIVGTGTVTMAEGNLRVVKGIPYENEPVVPIVPENGIEIAEIKVPAYTHSTDDVKIKVTSNLRRKDTELSKLESVLEEIQNHVSKNPLEEKAKTYDIGAGRKVIGTFTDSFEDDSNAAVDDTYYSASIDKINNVLRPEFVIENTSWNSTPVEFNDLLGSTKNLVTLPLVTGDEYVSEVVNIESNIEVKPRTTHTFGYHGYMIVTPSFDNWKSTTSRPDLIENRGGEYDSIKHHSKSYKTHRSSWNDWKTHWTGYEKLEFEDSDKDTSYDGLIKSLKKTYDVKSNTLELPSGKKVQRDYVPYIRSQNIKITVYGLKPNVGNLRIRFDGRDISSDIRTNALTAATYINSSAAVLKTDDYGSFVGWFTIPNVDEGVGTTKFTTGIKKIVVDSTTSGVDCYAEGSFDAVGYIANKISTRNLEGSWDTQTRDAYHQSFEIFQDCFVGKADLYFTGKENYGNMRPIILQLRKMDGDKPSNDCIPFSTVVKYPTDILTFGSNPSNSWSVGDTLTGNNSGAKGIIVDFPTSTQATVRPVRGEWNHANEYITNGTNSIQFTSVSTAIPTDGVTPTSFTFSEFIYLPKGKYCITLITASRSYQLKALDVNRLEGSKMTGVGSTYQGFDQIKSQILQFVLYRCKFDTSKSAADSTLWLKTNAIPDLSPTKDNPLYTYGNIVFDGTSSGVVSTANDTITLTTAQVTALAVNDSIVYSHGGGGDIGGLTTGTTYYVHSKPTTTTIKLKTSAAAVDAIDLTAVAGSGTTHSFAGNQIRVDLDSHGYESASGAKLTFKNVTGRNGLEAELATSSNTGNIGTAGNFAQGEIIYQKSQPADAANYANYPHGIIVDYDHGSSPRKIKVMMTSTGSFVNSTDPLWGKDSGKNVVLSNTNSYAGANHYKRMMNGIDLEYINDGAVVELDDGNDANVKDPYDGGTGYNVTTLENGDPTTGGTGTGLTVRVASVTGNIIDDFGSGAGATGGIHIVNPGSGYTDNDLITVAQVGSGLNATIYVKGVRRNEYQIISSTHDTIDVKRVGTGNVFQTTGDTSTTEIKSFVAGRTHYSESTMKVSSDLSADGPRKRVDMLYYGDASIVPESTRLSWERADTYNGALTRIIPEANIQLESNKKIANNTFMKNIFTSEYDRVSPVIDKGLLNTLMISNRVDNSSELSSYIS